MCTDVADLLALAARYDLTASQRDRLGRVLAALERDARAPTSVRERAHALEAHVADALAALELGVVRDAGRIVDLGSGAGFPGLPLAIALPEAQFTFLEAARRKCEFVEGLLAETATANARVVWARAEEWREGLDAHDLVTARAVGPATVVLEYGAPLLGLGGHLVEWRGGREQAAERSARAAALQLGMQLVEVRRSQPFEAAREHHLHVWVKARPTPERFPRRAGMARKRPLG